ncbi:MAG: DMT family transporter [Phycisphaerae bacterium]
MTTQMPGEVYALLAAFTWACAMVLFKYSGERVSPLALNLFKNTVAILLLGLTLLVAPRLQPFLADESLNCVLTLPARHIWILVVSGVIGIALADTLFFYSLNFVGVGIASIVDCLYTPFMILFSWLILSEQLTAAHFLGAALILSGVLISSGHAPPPNTTRGQLLAGILFGALAMASMAYGIVIAKRVLEQFPLIWAAVIRLLAGTLALAAVALASPRRNALWSVFRPSAAWKTAVPGAILGTFLAYVFWVAGFKYADASINAILNQTTVIFAIILATVIVKEPLTKRKLVAVLLAVLGALAVLHEHVQDLLQSVPWKLITDI